MKKLISILLSLVLIAGTVSVSASAVTYVLKPGSKYPTIYVPGREEDILVDDVDSENPTNIRADINIDVSAFASALIPELTQAVVTDNWDEYCATLEGLVAPMFESVVLDENGNRKDNSGVRFSYDNLRNTTQTDYTYRIDTYKFKYDWRIDPYENAEILDAYIKAVMAVTGAEKVNILGRCEGANIVLPYLEQYGDSSKINSILFAWPSVYGLVGTTSFFTGDISVDMDALATSMATDASVSNVASGIVSILNMSGILDGGEKAFDMIYSKVKDQLMPSLVLDTFGTMPSIWAMVSPDRYEEAKKLVFSGKEQQYAGLIEKIDNYHNKVGLHVADILKEYTDAGVNFSCVAKYGYVASSICTSYRYAQTDGMATVSDASLGATSAKFGQTLSDSYISSHNAKYISSDGIIDASTCLYPDSTWFVKNLVHSIMPGELENLCATLIAKETQPTVFDTGRYPQFMVYDDRDGSLVPLNAASDIDTSDAVNNPTGIVGFFAKIKAFFESILAKIKALFD
ncbi:MAG: hypothetical protein ACI4GY_05960 [Acutalibacteraceae bacterium]